MQRFAASILKIGVCTLRTCNSKEKQIELQTLKNTLPEAYSAENPENLEFVDLTGNNISAASIRKPKKKVSVVEF